MDDRTELETIPHAIVRFHDDYFAIALDTAREFVELKNLFPIPCCPPHIVGNTNLRGEIVTVIDIRPLLGTPIEPVTVGSRVMVIDTGDLVVGVPISAVVDTVYLAPETPTGNGTIPAYFRGSVPYEERSLTIVDLPRLLAQKSLIVEEKV